MAKIPEHIKLMLERCKENNLLVLTASCGCEVSTVVYDGEEIPRVKVCPDHSDALNACTYTVFPQQGNDLLN